MISVFALWWNLIGVLTCHVAHHARASMAINIYNITKHFLAEFSLLRVSTEISDAGRIYERVQKWGSEGLNIVT
jgi:hypothetical protein